MRGASPKIGGLFCYAVQGWTWPALISALGVAGPGADYAVLAAKLVALPQRHILGFAQPCSHCVTVRAAGILSINGNRPAGMAHRHHLAPARAFAEGCPAGSRFAGIIVCK